MRKKLYSMNAVCYLSLRKVEWEHSVVALLLFSICDKIGCCIYKQRPGLKKQRGRSDSSLLRWACFLKDEALNMSAVME